MEEENKPNLKNLKNLTDAKCAGTSESQKCILYIVNNDTNYIFVKSGLKKKEKKYNGIYNLQNRYLKNVRAINLAYFKMDDLKNLMDIIGLEFNKNYKEKKLRYGKIVLAGDNDLEGLYNNGLLINFFSLWEKLISKDLFLSFLVLPIVKIKKNKDDKGIFFLSRKRLDDKLEEIKKNKEKRWSVTYYKGIGAFSNKDAEIYFSNLEKYRIYLFFKNESNLKLIKILFSKEDIEKKKNLLENYKKKDFDFKIKKMSIKKYMKKYILKYFIKSNKNIIPSITDSLTSNQRKIIYTIQKKKILNEIKISKLITKIELTTNYYNDPTLLSKEIIKLAQNYIGSNNINLLKPIGQFGTRFKKGIDHAKPKYLYTKINSLINFIFIEEDLNILEYKKKEEIFLPKFLLPILPFFFVNGVEKMGYNYICYIPKFCIISIIDNFILKLEKNKFSKNKLFYKGFKGDVYFDKNEIIFEGEFFFDLEKGFIFIKDIPISNSLSHYEEFLRRLFDMKIILSFSKDKEYDSLFKVEMEIKKLKEISEKKEIIKIFKLRKSFKINYVLFDKFYRIKKYNNEIEIMEEFFSFRLNFYEKRLNFLISKIERDIFCLKEKLRFFEFLKNNQNFLFLNYESKKIILLKNEFKIFEDFPELESNLKNLNNEKEFDYLLKINLKELSKDFLENLKSLLEKKKKIFWK